MYITKKASHLSLRPSLNSKSLECRHNAMQKQSKVINTEYNDLNCNRKPIDQKDWLYNYQKEVISNLKNELCNGSKQYAQGKNISLRKVIYDDEQLKTNQTTLDNDIKRLQDENRELKETISHKENLITKYKDIVHQSSTKAKKLEELNEILKQQIRSQDHTLIRNNSLMTESNKHKPKNKDKDKREEKTNINRNYNHFLFSNRTKVNDALNSQVNILQREKEFLLQDKVRDHKEIIHLREMTYNSCNTSGNCLSIKTIENYDSNTIEHNYMKEISRLQNIVLDRESEIESLKKKMTKKIRELSLEKEAIELKYNTRSCSNLPTCKNIHNVYYYK